MLAAVAAVALCVGTGVLWTTRVALNTPSPATTPASFVDESECAACHPAERKAWTGSHHDLAMDEASTSTVLGDFSDSTFKHADAVSRFFQRDGRFWINATGPDGQPADFPMKYTFGVVPLQQYLLELPGNRLQAYTVAWDVGNQRWFDLYPNERIRFDDELHWTRLSHNWNGMCAECHSTDLRKNFDPATGTYHTTFARIDVGCQACHGPGSRHLEWATKRSGKGKNAAQMGLAVDLAAPDATPQIEVCARCHSRRALFWGDYRYGGRLMDTHLPSLLEPGLYHADGQILDEVFEYGSFLQSRMYMKGVRCSDCHDPHSAGTRAEGNALCVTCHNASSPAARGSIDASGLKQNDYDSPAHHFHRAGESGSRCVDCHMPQRTYMVIDPRRDHSLRIPRPDLSVKLDTPNACNLCHADKSAQWAAQAVAQWYGRSRRQEAHFGETLWTGRTRRPDASSRLIALARDGSQPEIVRATALQLLQRYPGSAAAAAFRDTLSHSDPLIRQAALEGVAAFPEPERAALLAPLLRDPVRAIRIHAARALAPVALEASAQPALESALDEYIRAQRESADRPEGHANLGGLYQSLGRPDLAQAELEQAIAIDPSFVPAYVNLADLGRRMGDEQAAERTLRAGLTRSPGNASLHHALGLSLVRQRRNAEALRELAQAVRQAPEEVRYAYVYGVALHDSGRAKQGQAVLEEALTRFPGDHDLLRALVAYAQQRGDAAAAARYAERLRAGDGRGQ
jgi:predicted CXXCH cytochrome family protein